VAGVPLIAYKNKALKAHIHVECLAEVKSFELRLKDDL